MTDLVINPALLTAAVCLTFLLAGLVAGRIFAPAKIPEDLQTLAARFGIDAANDPTKSTARMVIEEFKTLDAQIAHLRATGEHWRSYYEAASQELERAVEECEVLRDNLIAAREECTEQTRLRLDYLGDLDDYAKQQTVLLRQRDEARYQRDEAHKKSCDLLAEVVSLRAESDEALRKRDARLTRAEAEKIIADAVEARLNEQIVLRKPTCTEGSEIGAGLRRWVRDGVIVPNTPPKVDTEEWARDHWGRHMDYFACVGGGANQRLEPKTDDTVEWEGEHPDVACFAGRTHAGSPLWTRRKPGTKNVLEVRDRYGHLTALALDAPGVDPTVPTPGVNEYTLGGKVDADGEVVELEYQGRLFPLTYTRAAGGWRLKCSGGQTFPIQAGSADEVGRRFKKHHHTL